MALITLSLLLHSLLKQVQLYFLLTRGCFVNACGEIEIKEVAIARDPQVNPLSPS